MIFSAHLWAEETLLLNLEDSDINLIVPPTWEVKKMGGELSMCPAAKVNENSQRRIHLERPRIAADSLEEAIEAEIDSITKRWPKSSNTREDYKGSVPVTTSSGLKGLRADFYYGDTQKNYLILKYYFLDEHRKAFKVCTHIYGDEAKFKEYESLILNNLVTNAEIKKHNKAEMATPRKPSD